MQVNVRGCLQNCIRVNWTMLLHTYVCMNVWPPNFQFENENWKYLHTHTPTPWNGTHTHSHPHHEMAKKLAHTWSEHTSKKDRTNPIIARWFIVLKREQQQYYASNIFELEMINVRIVPDFLWDKLNERSGRLQELPTMAVRYPQFCNCIFIIRYGPAPIVFYQTSASHGMALRAAKKA